MPLYKYVENLGAVDYVSEIILESDDQGNPTKIISRGGEAVELTNAQADNLKANYKLEKVSAQSDI